MEWNRRLNWQPIPIFSEPLDEDTVSHTNMYKMYFLLLRHSHLFYYSIRFRLAFVGSNTMPTIS